MSYLLITESPAKAKKIQGFLSNQYTVKSSCGHIVDLEKKKLSIDVDNDFKPTYKVLSDKKEIVKTLKASAQGKQVILAADDDREGESIAWHCANVLKVNISEKNRIIFREISKKAIIKAIKSPVTINMDEVNASHARRIIDRLIGFKLSPCLWKHIKTKENGLSAGRVQSALLNLLIRRETYIEHYEPDYSLDITGDFQGLKQSEFTFVDDFDFTSEFITELFTLFHKHRIFHVIRSTKKKDKSYPPKPFITSTLQQCAQQELGFPVTMTMNIAQKLYEGGHITYMRTDSTFISEEFQDKLERYISSNFDETYYNVPNEKKVKGAQEAHEAIRPTDLVQSPELSETEAKLYHLIKKKTIMSHMKPALYDVYTVHLENKGTSEYGYFETKTRVLLFPGYLAYTKGMIDSEDMIDSEASPIFKKSYQLVSCKSSEKPETKPQLYNESAIVKLLEDTGIGRPSTYATIISTLSNRKYTIQETITTEERQEENILLDEEGTITNTLVTIPGKQLKSRIIVTPLGKQVLEYLNEHFSNIIEKEFTCRVESDLDLIAQGKLNTVDVIRKVYNSFCDIVDSQMKIAYVPQDLRTMGTKSGKTIYIGNGKYGPYLQIVNKEKKKKNISIEKYLEMIQKDTDTMTFDDCLLFLKYPKQISDTISICIGPHGYYMKSLGKNYSLPKDPQKHTLELCETIIRQSKK